MNTPSTSRVVAAYLSLRTADEDPFVVIGNYGRGVQTLWPSTRKPLPYTRHEAEKIADDLNKKETRNRPGGNAHWHAKPLSQALDFVEGEARFSLISLQDSLEYREDDDEDDDS